MDISSMKTNYITIWVRKHFYGRRTYNSVPGSSPDNIFQSRASPIGYQRQILHKCTSNLRSFPAEALGVHLRQREVDSQFRCLILIIHLLLDSPLTNSFSRSTASWIISRTTWYGILYFSLLNNKQANSVCIPSSRLISSFEKHKPGMRPFPLIQKMEANEDEKNIPSTAANATSRRGKLALGFWIHFWVQELLALIHGIVSIALRRWDCSLESVTSVDKSAAYISEWMFSLQISIH